MKRHTAPFPYYGGKSRRADEIWLRLGAARTYIEPFAGSLAVLLANPCPAEREIVCDTDGLLCNFWRALRADPEGVAEYAEYPAIHQDLTARHRWLREWAEQNANRLSEDPEYCDPKAAGWWVWGISIWTGGVGMGAQGLGPAPEDPRSRAGPRGICTAA